MHSIGSIPFIFSLFRTLLHHRKSQLPCFQSLPHSFAKTPGVGYPPLAHPTHLDSEGDSAFAWSWSDETIFSSGRRMRATSAGRAVESEDWEEVTSIRNS